MARKDLQGALGLLVLKTLDQKGEMHGYGIVLHVQRASDELLAVEEGSLYPALHRMEQSGWIKSISHPRKSSSSWVPRVSAVSLVNIGRMGGISKERNI
jgi:DNA-binding PadR family transcriptional regulator